MIAVGNVIGSNICNIALILGLSAVFNPITSRRSVIRRDIPIMLGISLYLLLLTLDSTIGRIEGATLAAGILLYIYFNYAISIRESQQTSERVPDAPKTSPESVPLPASRTRQIVWIVLGISGVVIGAEVVVDCAVRIMAILGVSEKFVGLTMVAFGTSLPELATSVIAAVKKEMDISIGNLVGSNVFNIMSVLGVAALVRPIPIPGGLVQSGLLVDYIVMLLTGALPWLMMRKSCTLSRSGGVFLLVCYAGYLLYLIIKL